MWESFDIIITDMPFVLFPSKFCLCRAHMDNLIILIMHYMSNFIQTTTSLRRLDLFAHYESTFLWDNHPTIFMLRSTQHLNHTSSNNTIHNSVHWGIAVILLLGFIASRLHLMEHKIPQHNKHGIICMSWIKKKKKKLYWRAWWDILPHTYNVEDRWSFKDMLLIGRILCIEFVEQPYVVLYITQCIFDIVVVVMFNSWHKWVEGHSFVCYRFETTSCTYLPGLWAIKDHSHVMY